MIELDGYPDHGSRAAFMHDRHRDYELALSGFCILRLANERSPRTSERPSKRSGIWYSFAVLEVEEAMSGKGRQRTKPQPKSREQRQAEKQTLVLWALLAMGARHSGKNQAEGRKPSARSFKRPD